MAVTVRRARTDDAADLLRLSLEFDGGAHLNVDVAPVRRALEDNPTERVFLAIHDGTAIGFANLQLTDSFAYTRPTAELIGIYVQPQSRRQGAAAALVRAAIDYAVAESALELFLRVNQNNAGAIAFYEHAGLDLAEHLEYRIIYY